MQDLPNFCEECDHFDTDETPDGENMWGFCFHTALKGPPYFGQMALEDAHGCCEPDKNCPLRDTIIEE